MPNYRRAIVPGGTFFFTVVTAQRKKILTSTSSRSLLRTAMRKVQTHRPFEILAIVLLPDHLHALWQLPSDDSDYSTRWRLIKTYFSKSYLREHPSAKGRARRLNELNIWQRRFYEHTCETEEEVDRCFDYIHLNPLKHGLVKRVQDWPWSSFHRHVKNGQYDENWGEESMFHNEFKRFE